MPKRRSVHGAIVNRPLLTRLLVEAFFFGGQAFASSKTGNIRIAPVAEISYQDSIP
ncbi:hypothetical protein NW754_013848 [Fusarium falciforme]|nr:hypothetical protein NW754_013848 [Fusarium falciforme]